MPPSPTVVSYQASILHEERSLMKCIFNFGSQYKYVTWYDACTLPLFVPNFIMIHVRISELLASPELQVRLAYPKQLGSFIDRWLNA